MSPVVEALKSLGGTAPEQTVLAELVDELRAFPVCPPLSKSERMAIASSAIQESIEWGLVSRNFANNNPNHAILSLT